MFKMPCPECLLTTTALEFSTCPDRGELVMVCTTAPGRWGTEDAGCHRSFTAADVARFADGEARVFGVEKAARKVVAWMESAPVGVLKPRPRGGERGQQKRVALRRAAGAV